MGVPPPHVPQTPPSSPLTCVRDRAFFSPCAAIPRLPIGSHRAGPRAAVTSPPPLQ
ncbi:hypothetical protein AAFF_G00031840 [Aldrovandia affinis]|uniref:Uncharacterized protein n=1 Tax=Aldrovandia affinis TaxID=143900 RepID=A0AAD7S3V9_9TELE|nr:hypothetical protein AAFF_G00031840 [Aldrovandia affinis]